MTSSPVTPNATRLEDNRRPLIMGVLNVTPDSFSDGGQYLTVENAVLRASQMVEEGADIIDVGGESTRPGSLPVDVETEKTRVLPVIREIKKRFPTIPISIDTCKFETALAATQSGATIINDITGASDIRLAKLAADNKLTLILMHMQNDPRTMQVAPKYPSGVLNEVLAFLRDRVRLCQELGLRKENLWVDPGIGFGKTVQQNLDLLRRIDKLAGIGGRVLIGTSRKSFIDKLENPSVSAGPIAIIEERMPGTLASGLYAYQLGASVFRVHDVLAMKRALLMWNSIAFGI